MCGSTASISSWICTINCWTGKGTFWNGATRYIQYCNWMWQYYWHLTTIRGRGTPVVVVFFNVGTTSIILGRIHNRQIWPLQQDGKSQNVRGKDFKSTQRKRGQRPRVSVCIFFLHISWNYVSIYLVSTLLCLEILRNIFHVPTYPTVTITFFFFKYMQNVW